MRWGTPTWMLVAVYVTTLAVATAVVSVVWHGTGRLVGGKR